MTFILYHRNTKCTCCIIRFSIDRLFHQHHTSKLVATSLRSRCIDHFATWSVSCWTIKHQTLAIWEICQRLDGPNLHGFSITHFIQSLSQVICLRQCITGFLGWDRQLRLGQDQKPQLKSGTEKYQTPVSHQGAHGTCEHGHPSFLHFCLNVIEPNRDQIQQRLRSQVASQWHHVLNTKITKFRSTGIKQKDIKGT